MKKIHLILISILLTFTLYAQNKHDEIDLSGQWGFQLDMMDFRVQVGSLEFRHQSKLHDSIVLPAITDDYHKGLRNDYKHLDRLSRAYELWDQHGIRNTSLYLKNGKEKEFC